MIAGRRRLRHRPLRFGSCLAAQDPAASESPFIQDIGSSAPMQIAMRKWSALVLIALATAACSTEESTPTTLAPAALVSAEEGIPTTTGVIETPATTTTIDTPGVPTTDPFEPIATVFIAALGDALAETAYADAPFNDPEVFIATGQLFCELLDEGADPEDLVTDYVTELTGTSIDEAGDDALVLTGSVLGVSVEILCPSHRQLLEGSL